jgi:hypothetical protein
MLYNVENTILAGKPVDYILDANGFRYDKGLLECDTETGRIVRYKPADASTPAHLVALIGDGTRIKLLEGGGGFEQETIQGAPPLIVMFKN